MTKRRSADKYPLVLYGRSAARYRSKSFMISIAMLGLWFITYTTEFLPRLAPLNRWMLAGGLVAAFLFVSVVTTVRSLGSYCLTSDGGNTARLPK